jgi:hypothetical protein
MKVKDIFESVKVLKTINCDLDTISEIVPIKILYSLRAFRIIDPLGKTYELTFDGSQIPEFQNNLRKAIKTSNFDTLDNIIIDFFEWYHISFGDGNLYVTFRTDVREKFINTCNNFKGKIWDDIVDDFFTSLYDLISSGKVGPYDIID